MNQENVLLIHLKQKNPQTPKTNKRASGVATLWNAGGLTNRAQQAKKKIVQICTNNGYIYRHVLINNIGFFFR